MPDRKTLNEDLFYRGSSANLPRLHTCENKVPFWDFSQFAVTIYVVMCVYVCVYIYIYIFTWIYMHLYTYMYINVDIHT